VPPPLRTLLRLRGKMECNACWSCVVRWIQRTVSFDGSNVDFGNPLYATMNDDKVDTTPAYGGDSSTLPTDMKYMPEVTEIPSQNVSYSAN